MTSATSASISGHKAFAPAVGLWFAALLGFGLLVMPPPIHDTLAQRSGLGALEVDARLAVSAAAALLGLLLGLAIAHRIARAHALEGANEEWVEDEAAASGERSVWLGDAEHRQPVAQTPEKRVFNPREEIDEDGIAGPPRDDLLPDEIVTAEIEDDDALMQAWREERRAAHEHEFDFYEAESLGVGVDEGEPEVAPVVDEPAFDTAPNEDTVWTESDGHDWDVPKPVSEPGASSQPALAPRDGYCDLSLAQLTTRLAEALAAHRARADEAPVAPAPSVAEEEADPVIAFLRREAGRHAPGSENEPGEDDDPQAVLRSALDKLSRVSNPK